MFTLFIGVIIGIVLGVVGSAIFYKNNKKHFEALRAACLKEYENLSATIKEHVDRVK